MKCVMHVTVTGALAAQPIRLVGLTGHLDTIKVPLSQAWANEAALINNIVVQSQAWANEATLIDIVVMQSRALSILCRVCWYVSCQTRLAVYYHENTTFDGLGGL
jgi:hypothetical protein